MQTDNPEPTDPEFEKDNMILSDQAKQKLTADPELAAAFQEIGALMRQAHAAWQAGQYPTFEDAARALGLEPEPLDDDDPDFEDALRAMREHEDGK